MGRFCLSLLVASLLSAPCLGDNGLPLAAQQEVMRRGAVCERIAGGYESSEQAFTDAMRPPANDNSKWFVTVFTMPGCEPCEALKKAVRTNAELQAFVNVDSPADSYCHYHEIDISKATQEWRAKLTGRSFPVIAVQPPRDGSYGSDSKAVIFEGFTTPSVLVADIRQAFKDRIKHSDTQEAAAPNPNKRPPWPDVKPATPVPPKKVKAVDSISSAADGLLSVFLTPGGFKLGAVMAALYFGLPYVRKMIQAMGKQPILNDDAFAKLLEALKAAK